MSGFQLHVLTREVMDECSIFWLVSVFICLQFKAEVVNNLLPVGSIIPTGMLISSNLLLELQGGGHRWLWIFTLEHDFTQPLLKRYTTLQRLQVGETVLRPTCPRYSAACSELVRGVCNKTTGLALLKTISCNLYNKRPRNPGMKANWNGNIASESRTSVVRTSSRFTNLNTVSIWMLKIEAATTRNQTPDSARSRSPKLADH